MINLNTDELISLDKAALLFPVINGVTKSPKTLYRYVKEGVKGVVLESIRDGGRVYTTKTAVLKFMEELNAPFEKYSSKQQSKPRTSPEKRAAKAIDGINKLFKRSAK